MEPIKPAVNAAELESAIHDLDLEAISLLLYQTAGVIASSVVSGDDDRDDLTQDLWLFLRDLVTKLDPARGSMFAYLYKSGMREAFRLAKAGKRDRGISLEAAEIDPPSLDWRAERDALDDTAELRADPKFAELVKAIGDDEVWSQSRGGSRPVMARVSRRLSISRRRLNRLVIDARSRLAA